MDKVGYKAYLQFLGNQQYYIGCIPLLMELEKALDINLDDYVPYNDDYNKVDALNALLPEEVQYNERLRFSINSYMKYRLSGFDNKKQVDENKYFTCNEYFTFCGSETQLKEKLSLFMSEKDCDAFVGNIQNYCQFLGKDEFIEMTYSETDSTRLQLLVSNYNINIKALTLTALALAMDIQLTVGLASATLAILGFNNQAIARIDTTEGEKCLILEAIQSKNRVIDENVFSCYNHQCVHNDLNCKYQNGDFCIISKKDIIEILDGLCGKNVFRKICNIYKYNF